MSRNAILSLLCMSLCAGTAGATFNVVDFGARVTDCLVTTNIQAAIDACHRAGGGEVVVPEGIFRTGGLELKSGVTLRLLDGATLEGSADCADYAYAGETRPWYRGLLRADGAHDIAVVGGRYSVIDGRNCFDPNGEESYRGPHAIRFTGCTNVMLKGYSVRDSANWAHALFRCANVKVEKVRVYGGHDGFDAHVSSNVVVSACEFHVGDDAIAGFGNECMTVRDTILDSSCSAARFGGRNCLFERCRTVSPGSFGHRWTLSAEDKRRAVNHGETLRHSGSGFTYYCDFRWGDVPRPENIVFRDCTFDHPARFFSFSFDGRSQWCCNRPLASIAFENCEILGVQTLGRFYGGETDPLSITLKNCRVTAAPGKQAQPVLSGYNFRKIRFENVSLEGFADPRVEKRSEGVVEIIGGTPVRVTYRKDPNDEVYTFEKAASLLAGMKADRAAFDGWMAENAARGEVWCRAYAAWRGASDAREEGEFFRRHYGYCFKGAKGVVASKRADGELSDVPFGAFVYALAQRSPIVARAALTDFIRSSPHTPAAVAGAQEALRRLMLMGCGSAQGVKYDITVSAEGSVNSIAAAMEQARALRRSGAVTDRAVEVFVKAGRYRVGQPIRFAPEDSGIHFTGEGMRETVIDGGVELPTFRIGTKGVWETDVPQGLVFEQLYVNGRRAQLARHPSRHYLYMKDEVDANPSYAFIARREDANFLAAIPADEREHVKLAFWQSWDMGYSAIKGIDTDSGRIDVYTKMGYPFFFWNKTCPRWAIYNCRAALDDPGEWYLDRKAAKLFYIPRPGETIGSTKAVAPVARGLVELVGDEAKNRPVRDVSFSHIGFEHQGFVMPAKGVPTIQAAILVRSAVIGAVCAEDVRFENCRVAHTGGHGIWLGGAVEGMNAASVNGVRRGLVRHCLVEDVGAGGIYLGSTTLKGKDAGPYSGKIELADSIIRNGGRFFHGAVAVWNGHVYEINIHHNDISDFFYTGISLGWLWGYRETVNRNNRIQFNHLHHLNQGVLSDMGAFYCLGDNEGSVVSDNWIHDVNGYRGNGSPAFGLYTDEGSHGVLLTRNLVERCRDGGINHHYGKENRYENNIFTDFHRNGVCRWRDENHVSIFLRNNIFWWKDPEACAYHRGFAHKGAIPGIVAASNVYWCTGGKIREDGFRGISFGAWQAGGMDAGSVVADPLFVDPEHGDWTLRPESPALKLGFKPFDWTRAGVLKDDPDWVREAANATYAPFEDCPPAPKYIREKVVIDFEPCRLGKPVLTGGGFRPFRYLGNVDSLKVVDTDVAQGRRSLVITKLPGEKHIFQPHLEMRTPFPEGRIRIGFAFRADKGDNVHFEVREYAGGDSFTIGLTFVYTGGWISVNGQRVCALPHGKWADVEFLLDAPANRPGSFSVSVAPQGGTKVTKTFAAFRDGTFRVPNWFGFMTYGGDGTTWALDDFKVYSSKFDPTIENGSLKIAFGGEGEGFGIKTIENRMAAGGTFGNPTDAKDPRWQIMEGRASSPAVVRKSFGETSADFWEIQFREKDALGDVQKAVFIDNRSVCRAKSWTKTTTGAEFVWEGVKLPDGEADVKATVAFAPDGTSRWNLKCRVSSSKYVKFDTRFPIVRRVVKDGEADWLKPSHDLGARLVEKATYDKRSSRDGYMINAFGCLAYAPMMTAFFKGEAGLYYGAHDPRGITKSLVITPERDLAFWSPASDQDFEVTIAALKGDWWEAARLYKRWALTAPWCAKGRIVDRADYPKRLCEIPLWLNMHGDAVATSNALQLAKDIFPDVSTGIHWHRWQAVPWEIGHYPEYFPTVPHAKETITYLRSIGQEPMVYTLPRLYSETLLSWRYAKADALCGPDGNYYVEKYGAFAPPPLVPMCMAQKAYQDVCVDYARRILDLGGRSIFLDQFASCPAHACYATNHVHKPGGGDWFYRGQHEISRRIHDDYSKAGAFTTAEGANDHFIDVIDGLLTVTPRHPGDVPFWHAVYNGYTTYFCTPENDADDADSFWAQQARDVIWGHAMGWFHPNILKRADKVALLRKLIDFRQANLDVLAYGELVGEVKLVGPVPKQPVTWLGRVSFPEWGNPKAKLSPSITGELPGILAYEWKSGLTGQRVLLFANLTSKEQPVTFESDGVRKSLVLAPRAFKRLAAEQPVAEVVMFKSPKSAVTNVVHMTPSASGGWQCRIARETVDAFRIDHIEVTSPLVRARKGEAGYFVLGDGRYGTFRLDNGICGERPKSGFLPVAGMKTPRGAYRVTVRGLALESDFSVVATNGVYSLVTAFRLRGLAAKPGDHPYEDLVVEFRPMPEGRDAYADIARSYREEKLASGFVKPLSERVKGNRVLAYTAESIFVRVKHGWKALNTETEKKKYYEHQSPSNEPPIMVNIDFAQFKDIMRRMKEAGIDRAEVCSVGGTAGGFDGRFPDVLPIPEEFDGERGLKDAVAYGKSLGYQMTVHFATTAMLECSRRWNPDHLCLTPDGKPLARGIVAGGRTYRLCPQVYNSVYMAQDWKTFRDLGFLGTFHIDVISCIRPYACFNPLHPLNAAESAAHFRQVGDYSRKIFGAFGSEAGMDWMAPSLDFALYTSWYPGWGRRMESPLVDRLVPFWQLVYHGIVVSNPFYATIDAYIERKGRLYADNMITYNTFGDAETRILKLQEFGGRPVFYYTKYEDVAPLKRASDDYRLRSHLQYCFMDDHRELAKDVFLTRYSNGEETVTNYGDKPFAYRGEEVPPRTFKLFGKCVSSVSR